MPSIIKGSMKKRMKIACGGKKSQEKDFVREQNNSTV